jgi:hypothetical protein
MQALTLARQVLYHLKHTHIPAWCFHFLLPPFAIGWFISCFITKMIENLLLLFVSSLINLWFNTSEIYDNFLVLSHHQIVYVMSPGTYVFYKLNLEILFAVQLLII